MKNANEKKVHSVHDFIIFLKAKIAIIIIMTGLLSSIAVYTQIDYVDYWEVKLSRTVDRSAVMETMTVLQKNASEFNSIKSSLLSLLTELDKAGVDIDELNDIYSFIIEKGNNISSPSPVSFFAGIDKFVNSLMVNVLSNNDIIYEGIVDSGDSELIFKKQNYKLIISPSDYENEDALRKKLKIFFNDILEKSEQIIKMQNEINNKNFKFEAYNFNIEQITRVEGYNNVNEMIKIVLIIFLSCIFFLYVFQIRKFIKLF